MEKFIKKHLGCNTPQWIIDKCKIMLNEWDKEADISNGIHETLPIESNIIEQDKQFICPDCNKPQKEYRDGLCEMCHKWHVS